METKQDSCCSSTPKKDSGILRGILYSLLPHSFCIAFILFSVIGSVAATAFLKNFLIIPHFFTFLIVISFVLATLSAFFYLKKVDCLCFSGIKKKWKYLTILYSTMILINLALFNFVFPVLANINSGDIFSKEKYNASLSMAVQIPCSGHASLIIGELKKNNGVGQVVFKMPNIFDVKYDSTEISPEKMILMDVFKTYKATIR